MSLTQNQKDQLTRIFDDTTIPDKLKILLKNAIFGWESTTPTTGGYGVELDYSNGKYRSPQNQTCFLGAAVLNKEHFMENKICSFLQNAYNLSETERCSLACGFDGRKVEEDLFDSVYYEFGKRIREIIICNM